MNKSFIAIQMQEVNCLVFADLCEYFNYFEDFSPEQLTSLFSVFSNISINKNNKLEFPNSKDKLINNYCKKLIEILDSYINLEVNNQLETGSEYDIHFELLDFILDWTNAKDELECKNIINSLKEEKEIFLGEFVKCILKINNIAKELENSCEILLNYKLLNKIKKIPELTLKYIASCQSLYI